MEKMGPGTSSSIPHALQKEEPLLRGTGLRCRGFWRQLMCVGRESEWLKIYISIAERFAVFAVGPRKNRTRRWQRRPYSRFATLCVCSSKTDRTYLQRRSEIHRCGTLRQRADPVASFVNSWPVREAVTRAATGKSRRSWSDYGISDARVQVLFAPSGTEQSVKLERGCSHSGACSARAGKGRKPCFPELGAGSASLRP